MCLTERVYKPMGLTKLYVPREYLPDIAGSPTGEKLEEKGQRIYDELNDSEKALIERYEGIVRCWIKQIREVLARACKNEIRQTVSDELQHWTAIR